MRCPHCKKDNDKVIDSRSSSEGAEIRRRRECLGCGRRYTTYERIKRTPLVVVKRDKSRMPFERDKVMAGLMHACNKRPIAMDVIEGLADRVEKKISEEFEREVPTSRIGEMIMAELRDLDQIAYVRFASVYRSFNDISEFLEELRPMLGDLNGLTEARDARDIMDS